jgi:hypothetical protein
MIQFPKGIVGSKSALVLANSKPENDEIPTRGAFLSSIIQTVA